MCHKQTYSGGVLGPDITYHSKSYSLRIATLGLWIGSSQVDP